MTSIVDLRKIWIRSIVSNHYIILESILKIFQIVQKFLQHGKVAAVVASFLTKQHGERFSSLPNPILIPPATMLPYNYFSKFSTFQHTNYVQSHYSHFNFYQLDLLSTHSSSQPFSNYLPVLEFTNITWLVSNNSGNEMKFR